MRLTALIATLLLAAWPAAHADLIEIRWSADGRFTHQATIAAGKFFEVCGKLPAGVDVQWGFEAGAQVDFNIHYHVGKAVIVPSKQLAVRSGNDTLAIQTDQEYCWMWTNTSATPTLLSVSLQR